MSEFEIRRISQHLEALASGAAVGHLDPQGFDASLAPLVGSLAKLQLTIERREELRGVQDAVAANNTAALNKLLTRLTSADERTRALEVAAANLQSSRDELARSNQELEQFALAASHDLHQPLRTIISFAEILAKLERDSLSESSYKHLERIIDAGRRMRTLIDGLLLHARLGKETGPHEPVCMESVLHDVLTDLDPEMEALDATVESDPLPTVWGNATQLRQLIQNLLANSIKFRRDAPPAIRIECAESQGVYKISIEDNGIGILPEERGRVFEIFKRGSRTATHRGHGLGLAICSRIVRAHGGQIWAETAAPPGARISFTLNRDCEETRHAAETRPCSDG